MKTRLVDACIIVTVTLAMLLGLELAARVAKFGKNALFPAPEAPSTVLKQAWGRQYQSDERGLTYRHVDYVEFREEPYRSKTITVDEHARRFVPGNCERADAFTIWMFGGSTMFGYGAPDESTIPAYLARILKRDGRCAKVVNFGAASWQSSQELIQLIECLKRGQRPRAVIFYDGVNDSTTDGEGNSIGGIDSRARKLLRQAFREDEISVLKLVAQRSVLVSAVSKRIPGIGQDLDEEAPSVAPEGIPGRAKAMAAIYLQNMRLADLLAREHGFAAYFFLQPFPFISGKKLTPLERETFAGTAYPPGSGYPDLIRNFYTAVREEMALNAHPGHFDLSGIFDGLTNELFADEDHLLPEGNRIVAERIAAEIAQPPRGK